VRLPWLAHDEVPRLYMAIPQYQFNKPKQHTQRCSGPPDLWSGSWVLSDESGVHHPLSPVIRLGLRNPRKKERKLVGGVITRGEYTFIPTSFPRKMANVFKMFARGPIR